MAGSVSGANKEKPPGCGGGKSLKKSLVGSFSAGENSPRPIAPPGNTCQYRRLPEKNFDYLAGVLFNEDFTILRAALIPHALVMENAKYVEATNSWCFLLRDEVWDWPGAEDVSAKLRTAATR